jgi:protein-S-isoprenylcysteine O-methyltransferase Ste14
MEDNIRRILISRILVIIQFSCLAALFFTGPLVTSEPIFIFIEILSILILIWSVSIMSLSKLNVFPDVRKGAIFISRGPYKFIRHPMYLAVILFCLSIVLEFFNPFRLFIFIILTGTLLYKIEFEEKLLIENFDKYSEYRKKTKKLIPFIY